MFTALSFFVIFPEAVMSNLSSFVPVLPPSALERALIAEYLLQQGVLFCELYSLPVADAWRLFDSAYAYARRKAGGVLRVSHLRPAKLCASFSLN